MSLSEIENVVVVAKYRGSFHWYRCDRELWVLDRKKWREDFAKAGFAVPEDDPAARFGIPVVNEDTTERFLAEMNRFEIDKMELANSLRERFDGAISWWDVSDLFPIMFVDFDQHKVAAFYPEGTRMERYVPDGWRAEFEDFATKYPDSDFPRSEKFWIRDSEDLLAILNQRGLTRQA